MNRNKVEWTGMDWNVTRMNRNDTGMNKNKTSFFCKKLLLLVNVLISVFYPSVSLLVFTKYILVDTCSSTPSILSLTAFWKPQASIKLLYFHFLHDDDVASFVIRASSNRFHRKSWFQVKQAITLLSSHSSFCNGIQISGIHTTVCFFGQQITLKKLAWQRDSCGISFFKNSIFLFWRAFF